MYGFEVSVIRMIIKEKNKTTMPNVKDIPTTTMNTIPKKMTKTTKNSTKKNTMDTEIELINFE